MTTTFNLPSKLLEEIFSRLPLKYVRAVKLTCKTFYSLSQSPSFKKLHIGKDLASIRQGEIRMIVLNGFNLYLSSVVFNDNGIDIDPSAERKGKLTFLDDTDDQVKISKIFLCDGLVLCIFKEQNNRFVVWNPYLEQTRWIEARFSHQPFGYDRFSYALGYEDTNSCRSYKFLRFIDYYYHQPERQYFCYEIYDLKSDSWTSLDVNPYWRIQFGNYGVSFKGNTYFCATGRNVNDALRALRDDDDDDVDEEDEETMDDHIICFDFTSETFGPLLPLPFSAGVNDYVSLSCVKEEKLAVLLTHNEMNPYQYKIWITTRIEAEKVSWSKFLTMKTETLAERMVSFRSGSFFIDEEKKISMSFDGRSFHKVNIVGEDGYFRDMDLVEPARELTEASYVYCIPHMCPYVPSLVQLKQPQGGKPSERKRSLEKLRFDQNMLRLAAYEKLTKEEDDKLTEEYINSMKEEAMMRRLSCL